MSRHFDERTIFQDSEERDERDENCSGDLFLSQNQNDQHENNSVLLRQILKELKDLRKLVESNNNPNQTDSTNKFVVENSACHKSFHEYLKGRFSNHPWVDVQEDDFKTEVTKQLKKIGSENEARAIRAMCSFAQFKFTNFRSHLKRTLFGQETLVNIQSLSIERLCNVLFRAYAPRTEMLLTTSRMNLTVALRSFMCNQKYFDCPKTETKMFWKDFKEFYDQVQQSRKWNLLREKEDRRIQRYNEANRAAADEQ